MELKLTRRQFGLGLLGALGALLLARIAGWFGGGRSVPSAPMRARYWRRGEKLAG